MNAILQSLAPTVRHVHHRLPRSSSSSNNSNRANKRPAITSPSTTITNQSQLSRRHVPVHPVVALNNSQTVQVMQVTTAVPLLVIINRAAIGIILDYRMLWQVVRFGKIIQVGGVVARSFLLFFFLSSLHGICMNFHFFLISRNNECYFFCSFIVFLHFLIR